MSEDDIENLYTAGHCRPRQEDALQLGPRKKPFVLSLSLSFILFIFHWPTPSSCIADPLIHHGRHFGRTVHALCSIRTLVQNGLRRMTPPGDDTDVIATTQYGLFPFSQCPFALFII